MPIFPLTARLGRTGSAWGVSVTVRSNKTALALSLSRTRVLILKSEPTRVRENTKVTFWFLSGRFS